MRRCAGSLVLHVDHVDVAARRVVADQHGRQLGAEQFLDPRLTGRDRADDDAVEQAVTEDVAHRLAGTIAVEQQHQALVGVGRSAGDGVDHGGAVGVDAQVGARDDEADDRRAAGGEVAGGPVGSVAE